MKKLLYFSAIGAFINFSLVSGMEMPASGTKNTGRELTVEEIVKSHPNNERQDDFAKLPDEMVIEIARASINPRAKNLHEAYKDALNLFSTNKYFNKKIKPLFLVAENEKSSMILDMAKLELICDNALILVNLDARNANRKTYGTQALHLAVDFISKINNAEGFGGNVQEVINFIDEAFELIKKLSKSKNVYIKAKINDLLYKTDSLLHVALENKFPNSAKLLVKIVDLGIDVNFKRADGSRAIEISIFSDNDDSINKFIASKTDPKYISLLCENRKNKDYAFLKKYDVVIKNNFSDKHIEQIFDDSLENICKQ